MGQGKIMVLGFRLEKSIFKFYCFRTFQFSAKTSCALSYRNAEIDKQLPRVKFEGKQMKMNK